VKDGNVRLNVADAVHDGPTPRRRETCADTVIGNEISAPLQTSTVKDSFTWVEPPMSKLRSTPRRSIDASPTMEVRRASMDPVFVTS